MRQEQLKKLAEWAGINIKQLPLAFPFEPHKDSNQLDMLEDKMIEDIYRAVDYSRCVNIEIYFDTGGFVNPKVRVFVVDRDSREDFSERGIGKTKNEARLNAILNYVENKWKRYSFGEH